MGINNSQVALFGTEISASMTGSTVLIGTLPQPVSHLIFDNQGIAAVAIYVNGTAGANLWRTFTPGEALVLDLRCAAANAPNFAVSQGTSFFGNGASGTFSISYLYAQNM